MVNWKQLGDYLGRSVRSCRIADAADIADVGTLDQAVVLLVLDAQNTEKKRVENLLDALIKACPAAIALYGQGSTGVFESLLFRLSRAETPHHVMTYHLDETEVDAAVESFFWATWPSDDRFEDWKEYLVIFANNHGENEIFAAIAEFLKE